jgi:hypothetical protein
VRLLHRKSLFLFALVLAALVGAILWEGRLPDQPAYGGKRLSVWLDELRALDSSKRDDPNTPQAHAVRAIGTNAIPWLLSELNRGESPRKWRLNQLLDKQRFSKYRFPDAYKHGSRAALGFYALGPLAEPAISELLSLLEARPDIIPLALSGMGRPALPALQQCLTNTKSYSTSAGQLAPIPGITIGAIYNAIAAGRISKPEAAIFLPAIRAWAQSTNQYAAISATNFLWDWHLALSADDDRYNVSRAWK